MVLVEKNTHLFLLSVNPALSTDDKVRVHVDRDNGEEVRGLDALMELMTTLWKPH